MNIVNIMMGWKGKDAAALKQFFSDELQKNGVEVVCSSSYSGLRKSDVVLLFYDSGTGADSEFEKASKKLIRMNIRPVLIISGVREDTDLQDLEDDIYGCWSSIDSRIHASCADCYFFDSKKKCVYLFSPDENDRGVLPLVDFLHALRCRMLFREEER